MDLSSVAPNSTPPRLVNSQLVSLPPVGILNMFCLICIVFVCNPHFIIFTWNLRDINVNHDDDDDDDDDYDCYSADFEPAEAVEHEGDQPDL